MANLSAEDKAKVERLLLQARAIYDCLKAAKPTAALGYAIRDDVPYERLGELEIESLCRFLRQLEKMHALGQEAAREASAPPAKGAGAAPATEASEVIPPPEKADKSDKKKSAQRAE